MLGEFSVNIGDRDILDTTVRSKKLWLIFKYLITNRHKIVTTDALIDMLWPDGQPANPLKLLYTHMSRLRKLLQPIEIGEQYILYKQNGYQLNIDANVDIDIISFERLINRSREAETDEEKLSLLKSAIELYKGDFLAESAYEAWVLPVANYYKHIYLRAVRELADIYERAAAHDETITLCNSAVQIQPYEEVLHERLIRALLISGDIQQARLQYRHVADMMQKEFGAQPSDELQSLNMEMQEIGDVLLDLPEIKSRLESLDTRNGALFCTSDMFKQIYLIDKRSKRVPFPVLLALITVSDSEGGVIEEKRRKKIMRALRQCLTRTLRQGDIVSQYSKCQYLLMLSAYLENDAAAAMARVRRLFELENPDGDCAIDIKLSQAGQEDNMLKSS